MTNNIRKLQPVREHLQGPWKTSELYLQLKSMKQTNKQMRSHLAVRSINKDQILGLYSVFGNLGWAMGLVLGLGEKNDYFGRP